MLVETCNDPNVLRIIYFIKVILEIMFILVPIGVILMVTLDVGKSVIGKNTDEMGKNIKLAGKRIFLAIAMVLVHTITQFAMNTLIENNKKGETWLKCYENAEIDKIAELQVEYELERSQYEEDYSNMLQPEFNRNPAYTTHSKNGNSEILEIAEKLWNDVYNRNLSYGGSGGIPINGSTIDCSSYVSWVLYEYGYEEEFEGGQHVTQNFISTDWSKNGWTEIKVEAGEDVRNKLQPGDILVRDSGNNNGHMNITVSVEDGKVLAFDCGSEKNWKNSGGKPVDKTHFAQNDSRPGKIIRVTRP